MSTLGQLFALSGQNMPLSYTESMKGILSNERQESAARTDLLTLADLERQQQTQAAMREYYRLHPEEALGLQSTLGGGMPPGPPAGGGPLMQQQVVPGQPPGAPQVVPGGQDLSRFAGVSPQGGGPMPPNVAQQLMPQVTPPMQSTLGGPGPQQGAPQQNPLLDLVRRDPAAGMAIQERMFKIQEGNLTRDIGRMDYFGRVFQGATDQATWDDARREAARNFPQLAAQIPPVYSQEAKEGLIARATTVKDRATLQVQELHAQSEARKQQFAERQAAAGVPKYTEDSTMNVAIDRRMQQAGIPRGTPPPEAILTQAQEDVETGKVRVSASQGTGQVFDTPEGKMRLRPGTNTVDPLYTPGGQQLQPKATQAEQTTATFANLAQKGHAGAVALEEKGFQPGFWEKAADKLPLDMGNYLTSEDYQKYKDYVTDFAQAWLRETSKGAITEDEWNLVNRRYFPQPGNSKAQIEAKRQARAAVIKELEAVGAGTGRTGTQAPPASQGSTGTGGQATSQGSVKPVGQMSRDELLAERDRLRKGGG